MNTRPLVELPAPSSALTIHQAAAELRRQAEAARDQMARNDYWRSGWAAGVSNAIGGPEGDLAGLFTPELAMALADWLDAKAVELVRTTHPGWQETVAPLPVALARQILGGQS